MLRDEDFYPNEVVLTPNNLFPESAPIDSDALDAKIHEIFNKSQNATKMDIFPSMHSTMYYMA
jgi:hypothetical protein